jgi:formylglycine-generating enzyme required for sulfatase activity
VSVLTGTLLLSMLHGQPWQPSPTVSFPGGSYGEHTILPLAVEVAEVSRGQFEACAAAGLCQAEFGMTHTRAADSLLPVVLVSPGEAAAYCEAIGRRLPTEAEWEWVAQGGPRGGPMVVELEFMCDRYVLADRVNGSGCGYGPWPVHSRQNGATPEGLLHMVGNVWEWTSTQDVRGRNVARGGGYMTPEEAVDGGRGLSLRSAGGGVDVGFRCVEESSL